MTSDNTLTPTGHPAEEQGRWMRWTVWAAVWLPGLIVALGAAIATAHGLYEVALAAGVPQPIAWLYPLITDGLALVGYATTTQLATAGRRYAWTVVVLAAGLSGVAQASNLAHGMDSTAPAALRFGVGAWPAIAAAIVAHLLYLLAGHRPPVVQPESVSTVPDVQRHPFNDAIHAPAEQHAEQAPQPFTAELYARPDEQPAVHQSAELNTAVTNRRETPARERARSVARRHASRHGRLPSVSELTALANVARGTAHAALKDLRQQPTQLQVVHNTDDHRSHP